MMLEKDKEIPNPNQLKGKNIDYIDHLGVFGLFQSHVHVAEIQVGKYSTYVDVGLQRLPPPDVCKYFADKSSSNNITSANIEHGGIEYYSADAYINISTADYDEDAPDHKGINEILNQLSNRISEKLKKSLKNDDNFDKKCENWYIKGGGILIPFSYKRENLFSRILKKSSLKSVDKQIFEFYRDVFTVAWREVRLAKEVIQEMEAENKLQIIEEKQDVNSPSHTQSKTAIAPGAPGEIVGKHTARLGSQHIEEALEELQKLAPEIDTDKVREVLESLVSKVQSNTPDKL